MVSRAFQGMEVVSFEQTVSLEVLPMSPYTCYLCVRSVQYGQRKVSKRKAAPNGATTPAEFTRLGPTLPRRDILSREAVACIHAGDPFGALPQTRNHRGRALGVLTTASTHLNPFAHGVLLVSEAN